MAILQAEAAELNKQLEETAAKHKYEQQVLQETFYRKYYFNKSQVWLL